MLAITGNYSSLGLRSAMPRSLKVRVTRTLKNEEQEGEI